VTDIFDGYGLIFPVPKGCQGGLERIKVYGVSAVKVQRLARWNLIFKEQRSALYLLPTLSDEVE
jgi:hypothetical protein